ncbi:MAG: aldo/keto reductase [Verrucomicrobiota bacterium]
MSLSRRHFLKSSLGTAAVLGASTGQALADAAAQTTIPKRKFGKHDDLLTVVGLGGHTLYLSGSQTEANDIVDKAMDLGINFYDNAWDYHGGEAEEYMGVALDRFARDKYFLMTKFCIYHSGKYSDDKTGAMKMLEDSLRRMKTDHIDLWMLHHVSGDDAERAYESDGALAALDLAKEQGKIRYTGFTGHTDPQIHVDLIKGGYDWDATLMPVSIVGALKSREFEKRVMPLCKENDIAVLGMKGFGGSRRTQLHGKTNISEIISYSLSYPEVCTQVVGMDKVPYVEAAVAASPVKPMTPLEREEFAANFDAKHFDDYAMKHGGEIYESCCHHRKA